MSAQLQASGLQTVEGPTVEHEGTQAGSWDEHAWLQGTLLSPGGICAGHVRLEGCLGQWAIPHFTSSCGPVAGQHRSEKASHRCKDGGILGSLNHSL